MSGREEKTRKEEETGGKKSVYIKENVGVDVHRKKRELREEGKWQQRKEGRKETKKQLQKRFFRRW